MKILKRARKRGLALFMALVMCLSLLPVTAMAAEEPAQTETAAAVTGSEQDASAEEPGEDAPLEEAAEAEDAPIEEAANAGDASNGEESNAEDTSIEEETTPEDVSNAEDPSNEEGAGAEDPSDEEEPNAEAPSDKEEADAEDASEEAEPEEDAAGSADELAGLVRQFRELLDAMEAFALTAENQEEYQALGMQAAALLELLTENWDSWDGMENDLARFQALADKQTGGASEAALISGENFTVDVVKVVNGNAVDRVTLTQKCLQSTGHSGYNHSTNLRALANLSGFSGYKGYNWSSLTTVPSTYKNGLAPNNNYATVHYNITGNAPYKANETLFLFFEENTTFTLMYDANGGSGAPGPQTATSSESSVYFIVSSREPTRSGYIFKGWSESAYATTADYKAGGKIKLSKDTPTKTLYAVWEKENTGPVQATYTVEWYDAGTGSLLPSEVKAVNPETRNGEIGSKVEVTADDKIVTGYTFDESNKDNVLSGTLAESGTVLKLYFTKDAPPPKEASYTVEWYDADTGNLLPSAVKAINPETRTGEIGSTVAVTDGDKSIAGYAFKADDGRNVLSADLVQSGAVLKLYFTKDEEQPAEIRYSVEWYDASTNRLLPSAVKAANPEVRTAAAGSTVSVTTEDMSIAGYVFDAGNAGNILSALAQSGAVLRLYFIQNSQEPGNPGPIFPPPAPDAVTPITPAPTPLGPGPDTVTLLDDDVPLAAPGLNSVDHYAYIIGYTDGLVHPEANITRAEVATIFFRLMTDEFRMEHWATENSFPDVQAKNWFNNGVSTSAKAGIIKGYEDGSFRPNRNITRAEFAAIAARFLSDEVNLPVSFSDISGHWAENEINRAVKAGWIKGYTDGTFRPDQPITRAEAVTLINRMLDRTPDKDHLLPDMIRWPDNTEDKWYYAAMQEATNSHDYERLEMDVTEDWTELLENRDWVQLEKEWSTAASAPGEEVADNLDLSKTGENA